MTAPTIPLSAAIATIDGEIREQGKQLHRAECDKHENRQQMVKYALRVLRHLRHEMYQTAGVEETE